MPTSMPLTLAEMLYEELEQLDPDSAKDLKDQIDVLRAEPEWHNRQSLSESLVPAIYAHIHKQAQQDPTRRRSALCLSGGGIRSATFNLGILQGLARAGLLEKFDYLATVSGGGFIGGALVKYLMDKGFKRIRAVDKKPLPQWYQHHHGVESICLDLSDPHSCTKAVEGACEVYNLAADMGGMGFIERFRIECLRSILINTNLIEAAYRAGRAGALPSSLAIRFR